MALKSRIGIFVENPGKNPPRRDENQQQTQPTYDVNPGNRTLTARSLHSLCLSAPPPHQKSSCSVVSCGAVHYVLEAVVYSPSWAVCTSLTRLFSESPLLVFADTVISYFVYFLSPPIVMFKFRAPLVLYTYSLWVSEETS